MAGNTAGLALKVIRQAAGMTQQQVSDEAGVSVSWLSRVESGQVEPTEAWVGVVAIAIGNHMAEDAA
jgi:predicted transcriptional regulator